MRTKIAVSAGGIVWREGATGPEIAVCVRHTPPLWALPKGTPDNGETIQATAEREVREETGIEVRTLSKVGTIEYWFVLNGVRYHKFVHHFLMEPIGGDTSLHDHEYDDVVWLPLDEALARLSYQNEARMLEKGAAEVQRLRSTPAAADSTA
jgi:8-oxo-dGTP pyrophosphatase MutT (NUDIX family)